MAITLGGSPSGGRSEGSENTRWRTPETASALEELEAMAEGNGPSPLSSPKGASGASVVETADSVDETVKIANESPENVVKPPESGNDAPVLAKEPEESVSPEPTAGPLDRVTPGGYYLRKPTEKEIRKTEGPRARRIAAGYSAMTEIFDRRQDWEANPEEEARKLYTAYKSGMPSYFMNDPVYMKEAETRAQMREAYGEYEGLEPATLNWMRAADNLRIARDDAVALNEVYKAYERVALAVTEGIDDFAWWKPVVGSVADLVGGWAMENRYVADMDEIAPGTRRMKTFGETALQSMMQMFGGDPFGIFSGQIQKRYGGRMLRGTARLQDAVAGALDPGEYLMPTTTAGRLAHDVVRSSAYSLYAAARGAVVFGVSNLAVPGSGFFTTTGLGAASEARSQAARVYDEALQRGMSQEEALAAAQEVSRNNMILLIGTEAAQNALTFGVGRLGRPLISGAVRGSKAAARAAWIGEKALSAAFEGAEEVGQDMIDAWALGDDVDPEALKWSFAVGVASGGIYSVGGSAFQALGARAYKVLDSDGKIARAMGFREGIEDITARISETKTASRIPEKMEEFVREATGGSIETVYIDGRKLAEFAQMADAESIAAMQAELGVADENANAEMRERIEEFSAKLAEELGIEDVEAYFEALATGTDVAVDAAKLLTKIGTDEDYSVLKDHIKLSPTEMSAFEAQQAEAEREETVRRLQEEAEADITRAREAGGAISEMAKDIRQQLEKTGRKDLFGKTGTGAAYNADLITARLVRKAADMGVPIEEVVRPGAVKVLSDGTNVRVVLVRENGAEVLPVSDRPAGDPDTGSTSARLRASSLDGESSSPSSAEGFAQTIDAGASENKGQEVHVDRSLLGDFNLNEKQGAVAARKAASEWYRENLQGGSVRHAELGEIFFTAKGRKETTFFGLEPEKYLLVPYLREIISTAPEVQKDVELSRGKENIPTYKAFHYLWNTVELDGTLYRVKVNILEDIHGKKYYDLGKLEAVGNEKASSGNPGVALSQGDANNRPANEARTDSIPNVDDNINLELQQIEDSGSRIKGSTMFTENASIIRLFEFADRSTMLHELGHVFLQDVMDVAMTDGAQESGRTLWRDVSEWLGVADIDFSASLSEANQKRWQTAQEKFAASFEAYLMEGKAPTAGLEKAFRAFKKWLTGIYQTVANIRYLDADGNWQRVELSDEARSLFDRVLATDEAVEYEAVMNDMAGDSISMEELRAKADENIPQEAFDALDDAQHEVIEAAKERLLAEMLGETTPEFRARIERRAEELTPFVRSIVEREPVYRAVADMQADPALRISREELADGFNANLVAALPDDVDAEGGVPIDSAAAAYGFAGAQEMLETMAEALPLEAEVQRRAVEQALRDEGALEGDPAAVASHAEDALYEGDEALDKTILEAEILRNMQDAALEEEAARVEAERENPLNRRNVMKFIREQGGLSWRKVKEGYGKLEAQELLEYTKGALWRKGALGLDEAVQSLQAAGIPVRDEGHLAEILKSEDAPLLSSSDQAYQQGFLDSRAANRRAREQAKQDKQQLKEWNLLNRERLKGLREQLKQAAEGVVGAKESDTAVDPKPYKRAAKRAGLEAERAMKKKDWTAAAAAKDRQAINEACANAAIRAGKEQDKILHFLRKYANRPNKQTFGVSPPYLAQIDAMLDRFDLRKKSYGEQQVPVKSLAKFVEELQAAGETVLIPDVILNANYRRDYRKMSMDELRALNGAVKNIERLGKYERRFFTQQHNIQIDTVAVSIGRRIAEYFRLTGPSEMNPAADEARGFFEKMKKAPESFLASIEMVEFLTRAMDGYEDLGAAHQYIFQPVRDAVARETELLNGTFAQLNDLVKEIYGTDKPGFKKEKIELDVRMRDVNGNIVPGKKWVLTKDQVIAAVLNMGNAGNRQRLVDGWGLTASEERALVDALTEQDLRFVQGIWDLFEGLRPLVKETAELMTGVTPQWVEATPLVTKYGTLRGGYYPIVTDSRYSMQAAQQEELANLMGTVNLDYMSAHTRSGHRKERAENVLGRPPLLNLSVVDRHLIGVIHDAALAPAVRDVNKLIHHPAVMDAVKQALGDEQNKVLNHWLRAVANNNKNNGIVMDEADRGLGIMQRGVAAMGLGANISGALLQVTGYFPLAARIGPVRAVRAMLRGMASPKETAGFVLEKSAFMREQLKGQDRDVRKMAEKWTIEGRGKMDAFRSFTLSHYSFCQNLCNIPGWLESYKLGLKKFGGDDAKAVKYADSIIRQTQGAGTIADLTRFETSGTWKKMFTMFYSWFRVMHNMNVETFRRVKHERGFAHKLGIFMNHALFVMVMPQLIEQLLRGDGPDDDETWPQYLLQQSLLAGLMSPANAIPVVRDVVGGVGAISGWNGGYRFTPLSATLESVSRLLDRSARTTQAVWEGDEPDWTKLWKSFLDASGYVAGLPVRQATKWWEVFADTVNDEATFFEGAFRVIMGRRKPRD